MLLNAAVSPGISLMMVYTELFPAYFDQWDFKLISFKEGEEVEATFAGPSCDSLDIMFRGKLTVRQEVGDLLLVPSCGAYTSASATTFNGFSKANLSIWEDLKDEIEPQPQAAMVG